MKKIFTFVMMLAAAASAFVSCTKDVDTDVKPSVELSGRTRTIALSPTLSASETRTQMGDKKQLEWADGDTYGIFYVGEDKSQVLGFAQSPEYKTGQDVYTLTDVPVEAKYLCAIYPYNESLKGLETVENVPITVASTNATLEFNGISVPMATDLVELPALTEDDTEAETEESETLSLEFLHLGSVLEFNVYDTVDTEVEKYLQTIKISTFDENGDEYKYGYPCTGTFYFNFTEDRIAVPSGEDINSFTAAIGHGEEMVGSSKETGTKFYVYMLMGLYQKLHVTITCATLENDLYEEHDYHFTFKGTKLNPGDYGYDDDIDEEITGIDLFLKYCYTVNVDLSKADVPGSGDVEDPNVHSLSWNFSDAGWATAFYGAGATEVDLSGSDQTNEVSYTSQDGLTVFNSGEARLKYSAVSDVTLDDGSKSPGYFQLAAGGVVGAPSDWSSYWSSSYQNKDYNKDKQYFSFIAPVSGTLKMVVGSTNATVGTHQFDGLNKLDGRVMFVVAGNEVYELECEEDYDDRYEYGYGYIYDTDDREELSVYVHVTKESPVYVFSCNGHKLYSMEYVYEDIEPTVWDFNTDEDLVETLEKIGTGEWTEDDPEEEDRPAYRDFYEFVDGLLIYNSGTGRLQSREAANKDKVLQFAAGGFEANGTGKQYVAFTATSVGELKVTMSSTGSYTPNSDEPDTKRLNKFDGTRKLMVQVGYVFDPEDLKPVELVPVEDTDPETITFNVEDIEENTPIFIYSTNGHRLHKIEYTGSVSPTPMPPIYKPKPVD